MTTHAPRAQQPEERTQRLRTVAQHEAHRRSRFEARCPPERVDLIGGGKARSPHVIPTTLELQHGAQVERHHRAQPLPKARSSNPRRDAIHTRRAASSAPASLVRRVYIRPCSIAAR